MLALTKEVDYITSMLESSENDRMKYEPNTSSLMTFNEYCLAHETDALDDYEDSYLIYVENKYKYFRTIAKHYKNLSNVQL